MHGIIPKRDRKGDYKDSIDEAEISLIKMVLKPKHLSSNVKRK